MKITLASASPRRRELLAQVGADFDVLPVDTKEITDASGGPEALALINSEMKALRAQSLSNGESIIVAADTIVYFESAVLGKPKDQNDAFRMLRALSGACHKVYTGVCVIGPPLAGGGKAHFAEVAEVFMRELSDAQIERYILTGEPMDKAGAYGIQGRGSALISKVIGDYFTVVGLPVCRLFAELENLGYRLF